MRGAFLLAPLLAACGSAAPVGLPKSACSDRIFEESIFTVCAVKGGRIEIRTSNDAGKPFRSFAALEQALGPSAGKAAFAMNAGMFDTEGKAIGLLIEERRLVKPINRRSGGGNFHLLPNGVFVIRVNGTADVIETTSFQSSEDVAFASQSGPMLVIDGKLHPKFEPDGRSRYVRNGVGIAPDGTPLFVISEGPVSFGKLARFFRDQLKTGDALYFDGSVSSLWDPANGRRDAHVPLGPMVVVFKRAASAPDRASRATP